MNEIELKSRAQRIADRANALGFTKDGKPMVIDQAYELVAASEGLRNQHVLRAKKTGGVEAAAATFAQGVYAAGYRPAGALPALVIPRQLDEAFMGAVLVQHGPFNDEGDVRFAFEAWDLIVAEASKRAGVEPITAESEAAAERAWKDLVNRMGWNEQSQIIHLEGFIANAGLMGEFAKHVGRAAAEEGYFAAAAAPDDATIAFLERIGFQLQESEFNQPFWECGDIGSDDFDTEAEAWGDAYTTALETAAMALGVSVETFLDSPAAERMKALERFNPRTLAEMAMLLEKCGFEFKPKGKGKQKCAWCYTHDVFSGAEASSLQRAVAEAWRYAKGKLDMPETAFDATPFIAQLALIEDAYCGDKWKPRVSEDERRKLIADEAFENYNFGSDVVEANGWESTSGTGVFRRAVFLATPDGGDTRKVIFTVEVNGSSVKSSVSTG